MVLLQTYKIYPSQERSYVKSPEFHQFLEDTDNIVWASVGNTELGYEKEDWGRDTAPDNWP